MLRLDFDIEDVASVRFSISPVAETVSALRVFGDPARPGPHRSWLTGLRRLHGHPALGLLLDLVPPDGYSPDFLTPPLTVPVGELDAELEEIGGTAPEIVRRELELTFAGQTMPARVRALHADPANGLGQVVEALARWHAIAVAPHWQRVHALLSAEVALQSRRFAEEAPGSLCAICIPRSGGSRGTSPSTCAGRPASGSMGGACCSSRLRSGRESGRSCSATGSRRCCTQHAGSS